MANPSQIENINSYEDFVENIATIRPGMVSFDIYPGKSFTNFGLQNTYIK